MTEIEVDEEIPDLEAARIKRIKDANIWDHTKIFADSRFWFINTDQIIDESEHFITRLNHHPVAMLFLEKVLSKLWVNSDLYNAILAFPVLGKCAGTGARQRLFEYTLHCRHYCVYCFVRFSSKISMLDHVEQYHVGNERRRRVIDFFSDFQLYDRFRLCRWYRCHLCTHQIGSNTEMIIHLIYCHFEFLCPTCNEEIRGYLNFREHMKLRHVGKYDISNQCNQCYEPFNNSIEWSEHMHKVHWRIGQLGDFDTLGELNLIKIRVDTYDKIANHITYLYNILRARMDRKTYMGKKFHIHKWNNFCFGTSRECHCSLIIRNELMAFPSCFVATRLAGFKRPLQTNVNEDGGNVNDGQLIT